MPTFAAIDIGSNAIRILFEQVTETSDSPEFKKLSLIRLPIRLGEDTFLTGEISKRKEHKLIAMAHAFNHLVTVYDVHSYYATATSAMRDAKNGTAIIKHIQSETGIKIEIIKGEEEAKIIYEGISNTGKINNEDTYLFMDVGGGSTEFNFFVKGERKAWKSFNIGTVRMKEGVQDNKTQEEMTLWLTKQCAKHSPNFAVGTGGNINKLYSLCNLEDWAILERKQLKDKITFLDKYTPAEMTSQFNIKPDRADVIVQGGGIYLHAMKIANIKQMIVPKIGVADGLIQRLYFESTKTKH